jgi:Phospholipase_D-nuclease N-terminal/Short C-terminal domain
MTLAADSSYPLLNLMWTFFIFFGLVVYFWLLITVFADLFRRHDMGGWAKTGWIVLVFVVPLIGALVYLIAHGRSMGDRAAHEAEQSKQNTDAYIRSVAAPGYRGIDEISHGKELLDQGAISQEEFDQLKRRVLV